MGTMPMLRLSVTYSHMNKMLIPATCVKDDLPNQGGYLKYQINVYILIMLIDMF